MKPVLLPPNPVERFYRGGARIAGFRGVDGWGQMAPEDWVGSVTSVAGEAERGRARLADGALLSDDIAADPEAYLGPEHVTRFGADPGVLVKLLDAGERLPVHWHPGRGFARARLHSCYGKTEAWVIVEADPGAVVHLGWRRAVTTDDLAAWQASQDVEAMLGAMHEVPVRGGDTVLVPAGTPHTIGEGVLMIELQEPTDLSVLLEWKGFTDDPAGVGDLGLGYDVALRSASTDALTSEALERLRSADRPGALFPAEADPFFRAERLSGATRLAPGFSILVVMEGEGALPGGGTTLALRRGDAALVPHAAGETALEGRLTAIRCRPPEHPPEGLAP